MLQISIYANEIFSSLWMKYRILRKFRKEVSYRYIEIIKNFHELKFHLELRDGISMEANIFSLIEKRNNHVISARVYLHQVLRCNPTFMAIKPSVLPRYILEGRSGLPADKSSRRHRDRCLVTSCRPTHRNPHEEEKQSVTLPENRV